MYQAQQQAGAQGGPQGPQGGNPFGQGGPQGPQPDNNAPDEQ